MGDENVVEFTTALRGEEPLRRYLVEQREHLKDVTAEGILSAFETLLPDVDRAVLSDEFGEDMAAGCREAMRSGVDGWLDDDLAFAKPWGFSLDEISIPTMIWQGSADLMVPFEHGQWLSSRLPGASAHLLQGEGHLSIWLGAMDQMLGELNTAGDVS